MRADERVRRFVDSELSADEELRLRKDANYDPLLAAKLDRAVKAHEAMRRLANVDDPSSNLAQRSFAAALEARQTPDTGLADRYKRLLTPRWVRLRLSLGLVALPAVALALVWVAGRYAGDASSTATAESEQVQLAAPAASEESPSTSEDGVPIRFVLPAQGASSVAVAGDFNGWDTTSIELADTDGDGVFVGTAYLPRGAFCYAFVVDGTRWVTDPYAESFRDDGFGGRNAVLRIN